MRLIKMFGLAALAAVAAMAFVGATSASATYYTQLCRVHGNGLEVNQLICPEGQAQTHVHKTLEPGTVYKLLTSLGTILCLGALSETEPLGLANPQLLHITALSLTGCGLNAAHDNITVTVEELPLAHVLKTGLDQGVLLLTSGRLRLQGSGINCVYDLAGMEFSAGEEGMVAAEEAPTTELGGKFLCPNEGLVDVLLKSLLKTYILQ